MCRMRREEQEQGIAALNWERPSQNKLLNGDRMFANGQLVSSTERTA